MHKKITANACQNAGAWFSALAVCFLFTGCAIVPTIEEDSAYWEAKAKAAAEQRWFQIAADNYDAAYAAFTEASKVAYTSSDLRSHWGQFRPRGGTVDSVKCSQELCTVRVLVSLSVRIPRVGLKQQQVPFIEGWIVEGGDMRLIRK